MNNFDAYKIKGTDRKGDYYESDVKDTLGQARAIARRKGGTYEIISRIAQHCGNRGMWSGGETGKFD